jgi:general secretion pathway protein K
MAASDPHTEGPERGFALLIVLWTMALLALLGSQVTATGRADARNAGAMRTGITLENAADAAFYETLFHLMEGTGDQWQPGMQTVVQEEGFPVAITIVDDRGKLDLNQTPPVLMQSLLALLGVDSGTARTLATAITEWRTATPTGQMDATESELYRQSNALWGPPGQDYQSLDELKMVRGMTQAIYAALLPYVTLALEQGPWQNYASPLVSAALDKARHDAGLSMDDADPRGPETMQITAEARGPNGTRFTRRVLMRLDGSLNGPAYKYRILEWSDGA